MMTALITLQAQLESILNQEGLSEDFKEAVSDGIYAGRLGQTALEQWMNSWINPTSLDYFSEDEKAYREGVRFVEQQWEAITGMF